MFYDEEDEESTKTLDDFTRAVEEGRLIVHVTKNDDFSLEKLAKALRSQGYGARYLDHEHENNACGDPECGHPYERHFDGFENNREVGCKYCQCHKFQEPTT